MASEKNQNLQFPLGATLLLIRGANQNLKESLSSQDRQLILKRRAELSELVRMLSIGKEKLDENSLTKVLLARNLRDSLLTAASMLSASSLHLSESLALV